MTLADGICRKTAMYLNRNITVSRIIRDVNGCGNRRNPPDGCVPEEPAESSSQKVTLDSPMIFRLGSLVESQAARSRSHRVTA